MILAVLGACSSITAIDSFNSNDSQTGTMAKLSRIGSMSISRLIVAVQHRFQLKNKTKTTGRLDTLGDRGPPQRQRQGVPPLIRNDIHIN
eukprot:scaffold1008_cov124-Cylindrotheca_fusiformis.AAC.17